MRFASIDDLRRAVRDTDAEFVPVGAGVSGRSEVTPVGDLLFSRIDLAGGLRTRGTQLDHITLGMQVSLDGKASQWDLDILPGDVFVLPPRIERDGCLVGSADFVLLSLYSGTLALLGGPDVTATDFAATRRPQRFRPEPGVAAAISARMRALAPLVAASQPTSPAPIKMLQQDLLLPFLLSMAPDADLPKDRHVSASASIVRRAEDWIDAAEPENLNVVELSRALDVPLRSLQRAFNRALRCGPASYLRRRRLMHARAALALNDPESASVTEIAVAYGFWELGRFAVEYRKLFGEKPSQTLARSRPGVVASRSRRRPHREACEAGLADSA